jgi:hypothetical protein
MLQAPFPNLGRSARARAMWALAAAELAQLGPLLSAEREMKASGGPGILAFELAGSPERAERMLGKWGARGQRAARTSLLLDFPFPATYALLHCLACTTAGERHSERGRTRLAAAAPALAWAQLAAALFDYLENCSLLLVLAGARGRVPAAARNAALSKFALLFAGWAYLLGSRAG